MIFISFLFFLLLYLVGLCFLFVVCSDVLGFNFYFYVRCSMFLFVCFCCFYSLFFLFCFFILGT